MNSSSWPLTIYNLLHHLLSSVKMLVWHCPSTVLCVLRPTEATRQENIQQGPIGKKILALRQQNNGPKGRNKFQSIIITFTGFACFTWITWFTWYNFSPDSPVIPDSPVSPDLPVTLFHLSRLRHLINLFYLIHLFHLFQRICLFYLIHRVFGHQWALFWRSVVSCVRTEVIMSQIVIIIIIIAIAIIIITIAISIIIAIAIIITVIMMWRATSGLLCKKWGRVNWSDSSVSQGAKIVIIILKEGLFRLYHFFVPLLPSPYTLQRPKGPAQPIRARLGSSGGRKAAKTLVFEMIMPLKLASVTFFDFFYNLKKYLPLWKRARVDSFFFI